VFSAAPGMTGAERTWPTAMKTRILSATPVAARRSVSRQAATERVVEVNPADNLLSVRKANGELPPMIPAAFGRERLAARSTANSPPGDRIQFSAPE